MDFFPVHEASSRKLFPQVPLILSTKFEKNKFIPHSSIFNCYNLLENLLNFLTSAIDWVHASIFTIEQLHYDLFITPFNSFMVFRHMVYYYCASNTVTAIVLKISFCLVFLSAVRCGVPRYRYDFLTKMG